MIQRELFPEIQEIFIFKKPLYCNFDVLKLEKIVKHSKMTFEEDSMTCLA